MTHHGSPSTPWRFLDLGIVFLGGPAPRPRALWFLIALAMALAWIMGAVL
jgi:hypothetical protein